MINLDKLPHPTYLPYPNHYTAAFFHHQEDVARVIDQLELQGYEDEDFNIFDGETGVDAVDLEGVRHTVLERFMRRFIKFSDSAEWRFLREADDELKKGSVLLCVSTPREAEKEEAITAIKEHGGYDIRYFTPIYIEEVE